LAADGIGFVGKFSVTLVWPQFAHLGTVEAFITSHRSSPSMQQRAAQCQITSGFGEFAAALVSQLLIQYP
jgi:hypothetical protein